jgi:selenocysteine lyase/cysteine desulfurase
MRDRFVEAGASAIAPASSIGTMAAVPIETSLAALALERRLLETGWEVPIVCWPAGPLVRVSAHLYNELEQVDALIDHLRALGVRFR